MAASFTLPRVDDAPILESYVVRAEAVLRKLLEALGDGSAAALGVETLRALGPRPMAAGEMEAKYQADQSQADRYRTVLNSLDVRTADIAAKSAQVAGAARAEVLGLEHTIRELLESVPAKPSVAWQLEAIARIDAAIGVAERTVARAQQDLMAHAGAMVAPASAPGGGGSAPAYSPPAYAGLGGGANGGIPSVSGGSPAPGRRVPGVDVREVSAAGARSIPEGKQVQAAEIYRYLTTRYGFTPAQAAGILGNMQVESGFDTGAFNPNEGAIGLCQWLGGRRALLEQFAAAQGRPVTDWQVQVDFMMRELQGSESNAYAHIKSAQSPAAAAAVFDRYYERSSGAARGQRMANAVSIASSMGAVSA
ncbi:phage tail tip lysozyme [Nocardia sp. NPDC003693]